MKLVKSHETLGVLVQVRADLDVGFLAWTGGLGTAHPFAGSGTADYRLIRAKKFAL